MSSRGLRFPHTSIKPPAIAVKITNNKLCCHKAITPIILLGILQKQTSDENLEKAMTQLKQVSSDSVLIQFQKVEFDKLMPLLMKVVKEQAVSINQLSVIATKTQGLVNADITFKLE